MTLQMLGFSTPVSMLVSPKVPRASSDDLLNSQQITSTHLDIHNIQQETNRKSHGVSELVCKRVRF